MAQRKKKRVIALLMTLVMILGLLPLTVLAEGEDLTLEEGTYTADALAEIIDRYAEEHPEDKRTSKWSQLSENPNVSLSDGTWTFELSKAQSRNTENGASILLKANETGVLRFEITVNTEDEPKTNGQNGLLGNLIGTADGTTDSPETGTPETGTPETGTPETGTPETGTPETGTPETGTPETGTPETGTPETGTPETGTPETGAPETDTPETGTPETGTPETGTPETGAPETGTPETGAPETGTPETGAPETGAPETGAPETGAPETGAPETSAPETGTPESSSSATTTSTDLEQLPASGVGLMTASLFHFDPEDSGTPTTPGGDGGTPTTPGGDGGTPTTPGGDSGTPTTPGGDGGTTTTPGGDGGTTTTPGGDGGTTTTPGGDGGTTTTPGGDGGTPTTPGGDGGTPTTPGGDSGTPTTPGGDGGTPTTPGGDSGTPTTPGGDGGTTTTPGGDGGTTTTPGGDGGTTTTPGGDGGTTTTPGGDGGTTTTPGGDGGTTPVPGNDQSPTGNPVDPFLNNGTVTVTLEWTVAVTSTKSFWEQTMDETWTVTYEDENGDEQTVRLTDIPDEGIDAGTLRRLDLTAQLKSGEKVSFAALGGMTRSITLVNMAKYYDLGMGASNRETLSVTLKVQEKDVTFQVGTASLVENGSDAALEVEMLPADTILDNARAAYGQAFGSEEEFPFTADTELTGIVMSAWATMERNQTEHEDEDEEILIDEYALNIKWEDGSFTDARIDVTKTAGEYDWANQTITWTITATPNGTSLAGTKVTDTLGSQNAHFTGEFTVEGQQGGFMESYTIAYDEEDGSYSIAGGSHSAGSGTPDTGDGEGTPIQPESALKIENGILTYTFPDDGTFAEGEKAILTVTTRLEDDFFADYSAGQASWTIHNAVRAEKQTEDGETVWKEAEASKTITTQGLTKKGSYNANASGTIDWTITLEVPSLLQNAVLYDLLPPDVQMPSGVTFSDGLVPYTRWSGVTASGDGGRTGGFTTYVFEVTPDNKEFAVDLVKALLGDAFPAAAGEDPVPAGLVAEIGKVISTRYLVVILPSNGIGENDKVTLDDYNPLPGGKYVFTFSTPVRFGYDEDYITENTAYVTWWNQGGVPGTGSFEIPGVGVDYTQAMLQKTGKADEATRTTTWTITANSNQQELSEVTLVDDLKNVLKSGTPAETSELVKEGGQLVLQYKTSGEGSEYSAVAPLGEEGVRALAAFLEDAQEAGTAPSFGAFAPAGFWESLGTAPAYYYDSTAEKLYIFTPKMDKEVYTFQFKTQGTGYKFFGYTGVDGDGNKTVPSNVSSLKVTQTNDVTLYSDTQKVAARSSVAYTNRLFAKEGVGSESWTPTADGVATSYNPADNTLWWALYVNCYKDGSSIKTVGRKIGNAVVTDTLPAGLSYLDYKLYKVSGNTLAAETAAEDFDAVSGQTVTFCFGDRMKDGSAYVLYVKTKVDTNALNDTTGTGRFTNTARFEGAEDGYPVCASGSAAQSINIPTVTKSGKQLSQNNTYVYEMDWTIDINKNGKANGYEEVKLVDQLPEGITYTGVEIYRYEDNYQDLASTDLADVLGGNVSYNAADRTLTFTLPVEPNEDGAAVGYHAYRLIIHTQIDPSVAGTKLTNTAQLVGKSHTIGTGEVEKGIYYFGASIYADWSAAPPEDVQEIQVKKVSSESGAALAGAEFKVEYSTDDPSGVSAYSLVGIFTTGTDGSTAPITLPADAKIVRLTETRQPAGYQLPEDKEFIVNLGGGSVGSPSCSNPAAAVTTVNDVVTVTIQNDPDPNTLTLRKVSLRNGAVLAGAEFLVEVKTTADSTWKSFGSGTYTTDNSGTFSVKLDWNVTDVRLTETKAPGGYQMPENNVTTLKIDTQKNEASLDGSHPASTQVENRDGSYFVTIANTPGSDTMTLRKVSSRNGTALAGAEFTVEYQKTDALTETWTSLGSHTTDSKGTFQVELDWDTTYVRLTETKAPGGYRLPDDTETIVKIDVRNSRPALEGEDPATTSVAVTPDGDYLVIVANAPRSGGIDDDPPYNPPGQDIPDDDIPLEEFPDEETPLEDLPDEAPPLEDVPAGETSLEDLPDAEPPLEDLPEEEVPLAHVPETGDTTWMWAMAAAVSGLGLVWLAIAGRKRQGGED